MKHLKVEYKNEAGQSIVLFDGEVNEVVWSDGPGGIKVEGKTGAGGGGMGSLLELLTGSSKARTEAVIEEKRAELAETAPSPEPVVIVAEPDDSLEVIQSAQG